MARLVFVPDPTYANQAALNTQLDTIHAASKITVLFTNGLTQADVWAHQWAQKNGVPWLPRASLLDAAGYVAPAERSIQSMRLSGGSDVLTAGAGAHATAANAAATVRGHALTKL